MDIHVYPNPVMDQAVNISIDLGENSDLMVALYDMTGKVILQQGFKGYKGDNHFLISLKEIPSGIYLLNVQNDGALISKKLMVH